MRWLSAAEMILEVCSGIFSAPVVGAISLFLKRNLGGASSVHHKTVRKFVRNICRVLKESIITSRETQKESYVVFCSMWSILRT